LVSLLLHIIVLIVFLNSDLPFGIELTSPEAMAATETGRVSTEKNLRVDESTADEATGTIHVGAESGDSDVKMSKDGRTKLIPQPSDDPNDPLNWSWIKKHLVFASLFFPALLTDFGMTYGEFVQQLGYEVLLLLFSLSFTPANGS
jgi:hypothetical protein